MGLDVYVGTFTRYYLHDWQTIVQQMFPGMVQVVRLDQKKKASPEDIRANVKAWRSALSTKLNVSSLGSDDSSAPYFTDKLGWERFDALRYWAAYEDQGLDPVRRPQPVAGNDGNKDPVLARYADPAVKSRYPQLLIGAEMWLPISSPSLFKSFDANGQKRIFGNCQKLLNELNELNTRTWGNEGAVPVLQGKAASGQSSQFEQAARSGWEMMHRLATQAVSHELAIILDY
jgi:hypothetical protein